MGILQYIQDEINLFCKTNTWRLHYIKGAITKLTNLNKSEKFTEDNECITIFNHAMKKLEEFENLIAKKIAFDFNDPDESGEDSVTKQRINFTKVISEKGEINDYNAFKNNKDYTNIYNTTFYTDAKDKFKDLKCGIFGKKRTYSKGKKRLRSKGKKRSRSTSKK